MLEYQARRHARMAQKDLLTERLFHCHYHWRVNWEPWYASEEEVKPQETLKLGLTDVSAE